MTREQKTVTGIIIGICAGAACATVINHTPFAGLFFLAASAFEWWLIAYLIRKADGPKPDWYPFLVVLAVLLFCLLFVLMFGGGGEHYGDGDEIGIVNPRDR